MCSATKPNYKLVSHSIRARRPREAGHIRVVWSRCFRTRNSHAYGSCEDTRAKQYSLLFRRTTTSGLIPSMRSGRLIELLLVHSAGRRRLTSQKCRTCLIQTHLSHGLQLILPNYPPQRASWSEAPNRGTCFSRFWIADEAGCLYDSCCDMLPPSTRFGCLGCKLIRGGHEFRTHGIHDRLRKNPVDFSHGG